MLWSAFCSEKGLFMLKYEIIVASVLIQLKLTKVFDDKCTVEVMHGECEHNWDDEKTAGLKEGKYSQT